MAFNELASNSTVQSTMENLQKNGIEAVLVNSGIEAEQLILETLPLAAEVMDMTSVTLKTIGLVQKIQESDQVISIRKKLSVMDKQTEGREMKQLGAAPEWSLGSVHAITETGEIIVASNTGSQLPAYAYGSDHVIWVVGTQKIVKNLEQGFKRIYEYVLPLESERANMAYGGTKGSSVNKLLVINKEVVPGRLKVIFVNEHLGF